ncbi:hypothetical protein PTT_14003, partial [Pyrenophora teres f. teres 0-1]
MSDPVQAPPSPRDSATYKEHDARRDSHDRGSFVSPDSFKTDTNAPSLDIKALTDRTLHFLATASNETLGACLAGLGAGTYLILGRVGLVLIGVVGGVVLHATWEGHHGGEKETTGAGESKKRELAADIAQRVLDWRNTKVQEKNSQEHDSFDLNLQLYSGKKLDYSDFKPETAAALTELTDAVMRDYVKWWYAPLLPTDDTFPDSCRQTFTAFILSISAHLSRKRPADNFLDF